MWKVLGIALLTSGCSLAANAQLPDIRGLLGGKEAPGPADPRTSEGLKEALLVSTGNAVNLTGKPGGYLLNEAIRIALPDNLKTVEKGLRMLGQGARVDEFVASMNRAAERAAPAAKEIFVGAIREINFDDARRILTGGDTAATDYFRSKTSDRLKASFKPMVEKSMAESGVTKRYDDMIGRYKSVPFASSVSFDVNEYVVDQALAGLFHVIAQQEKEIRTNPAARVTDLLKGVFGKGN